MDSLMATTFSNLFIIMGVLLALLLIPLFLITSLTKLPLVALVRTFTSRTPGKITLPPGGVKSLSELTASKGTNQSVDLVLARKWHDFTSFSPTSNALSPIYSFPLITARLFQEVIASSSFPLSVMGVIHANHVVTQYLAMPSVYNYVVSVTDARLVATGAECDVTLVINNASGARVSETVMTFTSTDAKKAKKAKKERVALTDEEKLAKTKLGAVKGETHTLDEKVGKSHSLKYAAVSLDTNPIHHPTYCKLMGMSRPIMHGLFSLARSVAAITETYNLESVPKLRIAAAWKLPLPVPSSAKFTYGELANVKDTEHGDGVKSLAYKRHVEFLVTRESKGSVLPHLRGVVSF
jgi:hypothetical protein